MSSTAILRRVWVGETTLTLTGSDYWWKKPNFLGTQVLTWLLLWMLTCILYKEGSGISGSVLWQFSCICVFWLYFGIYLSSSTCAFKFCKLRRTLCFVTIFVGYVARTLVSWKRIVFETCPICVSELRVVCIFKSLPRVVSISTLSCPCNIVCWDVFINHLLMKRDGPHRFIVFSQKKKKWRSYMVFYFLPIFHNKAIQNFHFLS